jgi:hypothetical protein
VRWPIPTLGRRTLNQVEVEKANYEETKNELKGVDGKWEEESHVCVF